MAEINNVQYKNIPFSNETPQGEFYTFVKFRDLSRICEEKQENIVKCQTIGILSSDCGIYYLDNLSHSSSREAPIQVSMSYQMNPPPSSVLQNTVQMFGDLMWKGRPVLYARIIKVLPANMAIKLNAVLENVLTLHAADYPRSTRIEDT